MKEAASVGGLFQSGFRNAFMKNDASIALSCPQNRTACRVAS